MADMPPSHRFAKPKDSIENRRARGEIACAECRRHKLKCDKAVPCSTCVRKGCESVCPNGTLAPTHGVKSSVSEANFGTKLEQMRQRIRQLEDALLISHSAVSCTPHPLLAADLMQIKSGVPPSTSGKEEDLAEASLLEPFGTLSIADGGTEAYYGGPEHDQLTNKVMTSGIDAQPERHVPAPAQICYLSKTFPFTPLYLPVHELQEMIEDMLPPYSRATALVEAYLQNLSWFFRPVDREEIMEELIPTVYKRKHPPDRSDQAVDLPSDSHGGQTRTETDLHVLALLFAIFANGAVADLTLPAWNDEGELYYQLARTALSLKPVFDGAGLQAVEAVALLGSYNLFSCRSKGLEGTWKILSFCLSLAASIGLNRDPSHFNLSPKIVQRRRRAFWELYFMDLTINHATGRPTTFTPRVIDCELPEDDDPFSYKGASEKLNSILLIRYRYAKDIAMVVTDRLSAMRSVKYSEILSLDQRIRQYDPQKILRLPVNESVTDEDEEVLPVLYKKWMLTLFKDSTLLFLHRSFFARALIEDPANPVRTRFGPSFLSMYRASASLVHFVRNLFDREALFVARCWPILALALHATIILGSVAACGTASSLAPQAFVHFSLGYEMFKKAPMHPVINASVPLVTRLRDQALEALAKHGHDVSSKLFTIPAPLGTKRNRSQDFNGIESSGHLTKKSFDEGIGLTSMNFPSFAHRSGLSTSARAGPSSEARLPTSLTESAVPYDGRAGGRGTLSPLPNVSLTGDEGQLMETDTESSQAVGVKSDTDSGYKIDNVGNSSDVQMGAPADPNAFGCDGETADDPFNPDLFDFSGSSTGGLTDVFDFNASFSDLLGDGDNMPGPSLSPTDDYSGGQSASDIPTFSNDPFLFTSPSPRDFHTSDFDVSFDMRASSGQESVLPLLPQDMDAWRTILQDSRFFGIVGESAEGDKGMPG